MTTDVAVANDNDGSRRRRQSLLRWSLWGAAGLLLAVAAIGALHTSWGRPILARLGGCPAMRVSAEEVERLHRAGMGGQLVAGRVAPLRPALGFHLDSMSPAEVMAWADGAHITCTKKARGFISLHCANVARVLLPDGGSSQNESAPIIEDLAFTFESHQRLISVDAFTRGLGADAASSAYTRSVGALGASLGRPSDQIGGYAAQSLSLFASARQRYRYSDYLAIVSISRLDSGLAFREQYLSGG